MTRSKITDFIAELVRAANEVHVLSQFERRRLLELAVVTVSDLRAQVGIPSSNTSADAIVHLQTTAFAIGLRTDEEVKAALLDAADMVRTLRVLLDSGTELSIRPAK